jgi:uncharacterized protein
MENKSVDINEEAWSDGGIITYMGRTVHPFKPQVSEIHRVDIAHALANTCRYSGHCSEFYSVAEHCINVSMIVPEDWAIRGLLHDAAEAYLTDIPRPFKHMIPGYKEVEEGLLKVIFENFGIKYGLPEAIKDADNLMLAIEQYALIPDTKYWPHILTKKQYEFYRDTLPITIGMSPKEAKDTYLDCLDMLLLMEKNK